MSNSTICHNHNEVHFLSYNLRNKDGINKIWNIVQQPLSHGYKIQKATQRSSKNIDRT
jgi:hypothetical protein